MNAIRVPIETNSLKTFKGNNPANAGQSLLEGKCENNDTEYPETLIVNEGQGMAEQNK